MAKMTEAELAAWRAAKARQDAADRSEGRAVSEFLRASTATHGATSTPWAQSRRHLLGHGGRFR